jgi:hypothetical protein
MKALFVLVALGGVSPGALAQQTATLGPTVITPVVDQCQIVATNQKAGDTTTDGLCISRTQTFLTALVASQPTNAVLDQTIADLIVQLATLASADDACNAFDTEIAEAIRLASSYSTDGDQKVQLVEIAQTVEDCSYTTTAALPVDGIFASNT